MTHRLPRIEICLSQIRENAVGLSAMYGDSGISLMGVTKAVLGDPFVATAMIQGGVKFIADSRIENIQTMIAAGVTAQFVLLRTPLSQAASVIEHVDVSLNTEFETIKALSHHATASGKTHHVVIMVELGDRREGVLPRDLQAFVDATLALPHIAVVGLGCNLACYGGVVPGVANMDALSELANMIESQCGVRLEIVSGGNSANYLWFASGAPSGRINNLRVGESILLGCETVTRNPIAGLHTTAFRLVAEVMEAKMKPSLPAGVIGQDAFGGVSTIRDRGVHSRLIVALGRQDVNVAGLTSHDNLEILGASSDHLILDGSGQDFRAGDEVSFGLDYGCLLAAMTSPFVRKQFVER